MNIEWSCVECGHNNFEYTEEGIIREPESCFRCGLIRKRPTDRYRLKIKSDHASWKMACDNMPHVSGTQKLPKGF